MDVSIFCWLLTINRDVTTEEYDACANVVRQVWPDIPLSVKLFNGAPRNFETFREILCQLMPLLMMRQQRVPRAKWREHETERGKKWIERDADGIHPSRHLSMMNGYTTRFDHSLIVMAGAQGKRHQVVNIGLDVKRMAVEPPGISVRQYAQSVEHKLTALEIEMLASLPDDKLLKRLCIILTIKGSLINGLGQPIGFDLSRIECNVPEESIKVDGQPLLGWEFKLFRSVQQGHMYGQESVTPFQEFYQISIAFYRGNNVLKFIFVDQPTDMDRMSQYFPVDNLLKVIGKLTE